MVLWNVIGFLSKVHRYWTQNIDKVEAGSGYLLLSAAGWGNMFVTTVYPSVEFPRRLWAIKLFLDK